MKQNPVWLEDLQEFEFSNLSHCARPMTYRRAEKYLAEALDKNYLIESSKETSACFYLDRSIENRKHIETTFCPAFKLNELKYNGIKKGRRVHVYEQLSSLKEVRDEYPVQFLLALYEKSESREVNDDLIEKVIEGFLAAWPSSFREQIISLPQFDKFVSLLRETGQARLVFEHGDFTANNIKLDDENYYLFDFEFCKHDQIIGFDLFDYLMSAGLLRKYESDVPNLLLNKAKYNLIMEINNILDKNGGDIVVYTAFSEGLQKVWEKLEENQDSLSYNHRYKWCIHWFEQFATKNEQLHIVSYWKDGECQALIPLLKSKKTLRFIGTGPDLFDQGGLLYKNKDALRQIAKLLVESKFELDLRYLPGQDLFFLALSEFALKQNVFHYLELADVNPVLTFSDFAFKKKVKDDMKRCITNMSKTEGFEPVLNREVEIPEAIEDFIQMHRDRWGGGPFDDLPGFEPFIKTLYKNTDLLCLDKLSVGSDIAAWHLAYNSKGPEGAHLSSAIPAYNQKYAAYSPGKILLYKILNEEMQSANSFDFGRGAEAYKYWFSSEQIALFDFRTMKSLSILRKLTRIFKRILRQYFG